MRRATIVSSLIAALSLAGSAAAQAADGREVSLDVPFVPQTEALCGGAAAAMVFRYWGDAHAGVQQFAPLVDRASRGIKTDTLVGAIEQRRWRARELSGSVEILRGELAQAHPTIILIEDRPRRYHYVVVVGAGADYIVIHDPAWGPSRRIDLADLERRWKAAAFWSLVVLPGTASTTNTTTAPAADSTPRDACERRLDGAIQLVQAQGFDRADAIFADVRARCPKSAGPLRELAGVRFAQRRWSDAAHLAEQAAAIDSRDEYAWDVLGSSRFMLDDVVGALAAWNAIGKPRIDNVRIEGLTRTRYALVAEALRLPTGALLTADRFERAERRLEQLPDAASVRVGLRPDADGFAGVDVALVEAPARPHGALEWAARGAEAIVDRELKASIPGPMGEGELWSASWRWWNNRPMAAVSFATPHVGVLPGVWRVDGMWERQTYQLTPGEIASVEDHAHGSLTMTDWISARVRYEMSAGVDAWSGLRAASVGGTIERRAKGDRIAIAATATAWMPFTGEPPFRAAGLRARLRSSPRGDDATGTVLRADASVEAVSDAAPLSLWLGAGDGHARPALLRAHPLLSDGVITGPVFARTLAYGSGEVQRWMGPATIRWALAGFVDVARASRRDANAAGDPFQVDAGGGIRIKVLGQKGAFRLDAARGLRDGSHAITVGWQF